MTTSNKIFILDVGMEKEQKQELGWRVSDYPFLHSTVHCVHPTHIMAHSGGMQERVIQIPSIPILVSFFFHPYILE